MLLYTHPDPDFSRLEKVLRRTGEPDRVPYIELFADTQMMEALVEEPINREDYLIPDPGDRSKMGKALDRAISFWYHMGYDYMTVISPPIFNIPRQKTQDTAVLSKGERQWANEGQGIIACWEDFDNYHWPKPEDFDYYAMEYVARRLPKEMKIIFMSQGGPLENVTWLMGMVNLSLSLVDDADLVEAVSEKVGQTLVDMYKTVASMDRVGALWLGDDMGFNTGTLISPTHLRKYVFPWQRKLVEISHEQGVPFLLHSCGNLRTIMDELIDDVGIDAKHSFQDNVMPVTEAKEIYGDRIALLGGVDMDFLCRSSETEIRAYCRNVIDKCAPGGGYAFGTGNSVANYIPLENYVVMLEECRQYGKY
jgi:uroporphyrinogen decarboxylase